MLDNLNPANFDQEAWQYALKTSYSNVGGDEREYAAWRTHGTAQQSAAQMETSFTKPDNLDADSQHTLDLLRKLAQENLDNRGDIG